MQNVVKYVCILGFISTLNSHAIAQNATEMPVIRPIPFGTTLPQDGVWDLVGVKIGATIEETTAQLKNLDPAREPNLIKGSTGVGDNKGNNVSFQYNSNLTHEFNNKDGSREYWKAGFTTNITEQRSFLISRTIDYSMASKQGSLPELMSGLNAKYGNPSAVVKEGSLIQVYYVWFNGSRTMFDESQFRRVRYSGGTPENCSSIHGTTFDRYAFEGRRQNINAGCSAVISAVIYLGTREDLISRVVFEMHDRKRFFESAAATDKFLIEELDKKIRGQTGVGPRL